MLALAAAVIGIGTLAAALAVRAVLDERPGEFALDERPRPVVQLRAVNSDDFTTEQLTVVVGADVVIELFNDDSHPHDVAIETNQGVVTAGPPAEPGGSVRYEFAAGTIPPGEHRFFCTLHPWMQGVLVAEGGATQEQ